MLWHILTLLNKFWTSFSVRSSNYIRTKKDADSNWTRKKLESDFHTKANVCSYQTVHTVDLIWILARHQRQVTKSLHPQKAISQHTTTTHRTTFKKQRHHDLPHPPASSGFTCKSECDHCMIQCMIAHDLCNIAMHFLNVKLIIHLFYWLFFCRPLTSVIVDKR